MTGTKPEMTFADDDALRVLKIVLRDESGSLISVLNAIHDFGYDYRQVYCTQRLDGDFDLLVHILARINSLDLDVLCDQLEELSNIVELGKVGQRRNAHRAS